jgi:hypothetical protein
MKRVKKKIHKTKDPTWDTHTYSNDNSNYPFDIEYMKYHNPREGRDQIIFLYTDKDTKKICKHRILR